MIVVTGALGFIGSNMCKFLNSIGYNDLVLVDSPEKWVNALGVRFVDLIDYTRGVDFIERAIQKHANSIEVIFHIGANSDVLLTDAKKMIDENFEHSKFWFSVAEKLGIPLIYTSSSAVYGNSGCFKVSYECEKPHNEYAFSKLAFDCYVRHKLNVGMKNKVVGFRLFNVFGEGEYHKGKNASIPYRFFSFILEKGYIDLFDADIRRDYVSVNDLCSILYQAWKKDVSSGIYNLGSGIPISHEEVAMLVVETMREAGIIKGNINECIKKVNIPRKLIGRFQFYTKAEDLLPWISDTTKNVYDKMKAYIRTLSAKLLGGTKCT